MSYADFFTVKNLSGPTSATASSPGSWGQLNGGWGTSAQTLTWTDSSTNTAGNYIHETNTGYDYGVYHHPNFEYSQDKMLEALDKFMKREDAAEQKSNTKENVEMFKLYRVVLVYGENRNDPVVLTAEDVLARDGEDAKIKSGLMSKVDSKWDADYLTIEAIPICDVKIKSKPTEVKNV